MTLISTDQLPTRATRWTDEDTVLAGSPMLAAAATTQAYNGLAYINPSANGDLISHGVFLKSGTYTLYTLGATNTDHGIVDWYVDDVVVSAGQDWYAGALTWNVIKSFSFTVSYDGWHTIKIKTNGKNGASSNYFFTPIKFWIKQASDLTPGPGLDGVTYFDFTNGLSTRSACWHDEDTVLAGNAIVQNLQGSQAYNTAPFQSPATDGASFTNEVFLEAGTYIFNVLGVMNTDCGKIDWYLDGLIFVTGQDWYAGVLTWNVVKTGSVTITLPGRHAIRGVVNGKNGLSSNYAVSPTKYWFTQATD